MNTFCTGNTETPGSDGERSYTDEMYWEILTKSYTDDIEMPYKFSSLFFMVFQSKLCKIRRKFSFRSHWHLWKDQRRCSNCLCVTNVTWRSRCTILLTSIGSSWRTPHSTRHPLKTILTGILTVSLISIETNISKINTLQGYKLYTTR